MRVSLTKDAPENKLGETLVHVEVSEVDDPPTFIYSHSFRYIVPSGNGNDGEIIIYNDKIGASDGTHYSFSLEKCRNKNCQKDGCPDTTGKTNRLLVANVFHTQPTLDALGYFGTALFKALFFGRAGQLLQKTEPMHTNGRIFLQLNKHNDLDAIPWEYANDRMKFLVHQRKFVRIQERSQKPLPILPLRIVAVVPDPISTDLADLHLSGQFRSFINGFTKNKKAVKLERVFPPTLRQMDTQLMKERKTATVLHFMGHCGQRADGPRALIFEHHNNGKEDYVDVSRLVSTLDNLRLAFLSACDSRNVARVLLERGVPYTIGSNCRIPDDLAREFEFEFYKFLTGGSTVERAMCQARASLQNPDDGRRSDYFAGAMVFYSSKFGEDDGAFQCEDGDPDIQLHEPLHNLMELLTVSSFRGQEKELSELYIDLKRMVDRGPHTYTIKGIGGPEFAVGAMRRMSHLFPGGIFAWAFDKEITSAKNYFRRLGEIMFSEGVWTQLMEKHGSDIQELGSAIIKAFGTRATCLLIFHHADILDLGEKERNVHAMELGTWIRRVASEQIKILVTSNKYLDWCTGGIMELSIDLDACSGEREHSSTSDKERIHEYFAPTKEPIYFHGVPTKNLAFVERSDILVSMEAALGESGSKSGTCRILVLKGLGGMGKTQLMLRYCYLHRAAYDYIFWLEIDNWSMVVESFRKLAIKLGINEESTRGEDSEKKIINWLHVWFNEKTKWLLLLNNGDDDEAIEKLLEILPRIGGNIILTTRMHIPPRKATVIRVDKMQENEAIALLYSVRSMDLVNLTSAKFRCAQEIITELDYMPLAIDLARAYINDTLISFEKYLNLLKDKKGHVKLLKHSDEEDPYRYKHTVATVWQLSFERLRDLNPTTVQLLDAFTFFHPEKIPTCIFQQQCMVLKLAASETDSEQSGEAIRKAIALLVRFSFVTRTTREMEDEDDKEDPASDLLTIHRLVQKVIYDVIDDEQRLCWAHNLATAFNKDTEYDNSDIYALRTQRIMDIYLSHIRHFIKLVGSFSQKPLVSKDLSLLLDRAIWYLLLHGTYFGVDKLAQFSTQVSEAVYGQDHHQIVKSLMNQALLYRHQGKYDETEPLYKRALAIREKVLGLEHPDTAMVLNSLANLYSCQGKHNEAEPLYKQSLAITEKVLGSKDPATAMSMSNLANGYWYQGKYDEAESLHKQALAIREKVLGSEHPDTAQSMNNLAVLYNDQGKYGEAEPLNKQALAIREKVLGSEHPDTTTSLVNLANVYSGQGKYDKAESLSKRALAICEKVLGSEHPDTASSLNNLAMLYIDRGRHGEAEPLNKRALVIRENVLGSEHPDTATSLDNLAVLYKNQSKYDEAEPLYKRALAIREKVLGSEHQKTARSLNNLAVLYNDQGKCGEAEPLYKQALAIREKVLGLEHPDTAQSMNNLANVYSGQGKYDEAKPLYRQALAIREKVLGLEHPDTAESLNNLAILYNGQGKYDEAEPLYRQALAIREKVLGLEHPNTAASMNNLANGYYAQGKYHEAELLHKQALASKEKVFGSEHPDTAASLLNLANVCCRQRKYDEAESLYKRALAIREKVLGSEHPDTAQSMNNLAILYQYRGKYDGAEPLFKQALVIREKTLGSEHPKTAESLLNLANICRGQGKYDETESLYKRALAIREKMLGSEHPDTAMILNDLAKLCSDQSKYDEAESLYKRVVAIREKTLGLEHFDTVMSLDNLAILYKNRGKYDEAESLYKRTLANREKVLGSEHPDTAMILNDLAKLYSDQSKYDEAESLYKRVVAIREKTLGLEHLDTAMSLDNLAILYKNQGKYDEAEPLHKRALVIREKTLGSEHPNTATSLHNLADIYRDQGKYDEAELLYKRALVIGSNPNTFASLSSLATLYIYLRKYNEAEPLLKRCLAISEKKIGSEHPYTTTLLNYLGSICVLQKGFTKAQRWFLKADGAICNIIPIDIGNEADITLEKFLNGVDSENLQTSVQQLLNANEFEPSVVFAIGVFCELGLGISKNLPMAMELFAKAAKVNKLAASHMENILNEMNKDEHNTGQPCGHVYFKGEEFYTCYTCGNEGSCLCLQCFYSTNHDNHVVTMRVNSGSDSFCDCGDPGAWKIILHCRHHSLPLKRSERLCWDQSILTPRTLSFFLLFFFFFLLLVDTVN